MKKNIEKTKYVLFSVEEIRAAMMEYFWDDNSHWRKVYNMQSDLAKNAINEVVKKQAEEDFKEFGENIFKAAIGD